MIQLAKFIGRFGCMLLAASLILQAVAIRAATVTVCDETELRAAMASGGTILFGCDGVISVSQTITNQANVILDANGHSVVLSGGDQVAIFHNLPGLSLTLLGLTLANGMGVNGAAVYNEDAIVVASNCRFQNNRAVGALPDVAGVGGAIYSRGSLAIDSSRFDNNQASSPHALAIGQKGLDATGGAIASFGALSITNTAFTGNRCYAGGGGPASILNAPRTLPAGAGGTARGAAVYAMSSFLATTCVFSNNLAQAGNGGAVGNNYDSFASGGGAGGNAFGSALFLDSAIGSLQNTEFAANTLIAGGGVKAFGGSAGGTVYLASGILDASGNSWIQNSATSGAGGDPVSRQSNLGSAAGWARGGGMYVEAGEFNGTNNTFYANQLTGGVGGFGIALSVLDLQSHGGAGGAALGAAMAIQSGAVRVVHNTIAFNRATPGGGGGYGFKEPFGTKGVNGDRGRADGAGIYNLQGSVLIANSLLVSNQVTGLGNPLTSSFSANVYGPIADGSFNISSDLSVPLAASGIDPKLGPLDFYGGPTRVCSLLPGSAAIDFSNSARSPSMDQRGLTRHSGRAPDAGAFELQKPVLQIDNNADLKERVASGGQVAFDKPVYFYLDETLEILKTTTLDGTSFPIGLDGRNSIRPIHVHPGVKLTLLHVSIVNGAGADGGGLWNESGNVTLLNCKFIDDRAYGTNGARGLYSAAMSTAGAPGGSGLDARGGAIFNSGTLLASNVVFTSNTTVGGTGGDGGLGGDCITYLLDGYACRGSYAPGSGGAGGLSGAGHGGALFNSGNASLIACAFVQNHAAGGAGGSGSIYGALGCVPVPPSTLSGSGATGGSALGGTIYNSGTMILANSSLTENAATGGPGGTGGPASLGNYFTPGSGGDGGFARGGAIWNSGSLSATNVTLARNESLGGTGGSAGSLNPFIPCSAGGNGGNSAAGALFDTAQARLVHCTIAENTVVAGSFGPSRSDCTPPVIGLASGANLVSTSTSGPTIFGTILLNTSALSAVDGNFVDAGFNIASDGVGFKEATSRAQLDPQLLSLRTDSATAYYPLAAGSPALDQVPAASSLSTDQRGAHRPSGVASDIGAIERTISDVSPTIQLTDESTLSILYQAWPGMDYVLFDSTAGFGWTSFRTNRADANGALLFDSINRVSQRTHFFQVRDLTQ